MNQFDRCLLADRALRTLASEPQASRAYPASVPGCARRCDRLSERERREAAALMRVNHVGEVCAQAMYDAQALAAPSPSCARHSSALPRRRPTIWRGRSSESRAGRPHQPSESAVVRGRVCDRDLRRQDGRSCESWILAETERQVERHLEGHLERLPASDHVSRAIVEQMRHEEAQHAEAAVLNGGATLPFPARWAMRLARAMMTKTAHHI